MTAERIRFTKHATEKFALLRTYGFRVTEAMVKETILNSDLEESRGDQVLAVKPLNNEFALRVV